MNSFNHLRRKGGWWECVCVCLCVRARPRACKRDRECPYHGVDILSGRGNVENQCCQPTFACFHKEETRNIILVF
jgi:hypothetical protein